ncbi:hypothetical protein TCAL_15653, partial [Tigriopus californicus]
MRQFASGRSINGTHQVGSNTDSTNLSQAFGHLQSIMVWQRGSSVSRLNESRYWPREVSSGERPTQHPQPLIEHQLNRKFESLHIAININVFLVVSSQLDADKLHCLLGTFRASNLVGNEARGSK